MADKHFGLQFFLSFEISDFSLFFITTAILPCPCSKKSPPFRKLNPSREKVNHFLKKCLTYSFEAI